VLANRALRGSVHDYRARRYSTGSSEVTNSVGEISFLIKECGKGGSTVIERMVGGGR